MMAGLTDWLKNSIPGIIVLGALGSIVALAALMLLRYLASLTRQFLTNILPDQATRIVKWVLEKVDKFFYKLGYEVGHMGVGKNTQITIAFFAFHLSRAVGWLMAFAIFSLLAAMTLANQGALILTLGAYLLVVATFVSAWFAFKHLLAITMCYKHMSDIIKAAERGDETTTEDTQSLEPETEK